MTSSDGRGVDPPGQVTLAWAHQPDPGAAGADGRLQVLNLVVAQRGVGIGTSRGFCP